MVYFESLARLIPAVAILLCERSENIEARGVDLVNLARLVKLVRSIKLVRLIKSVRMVKLLSLKRLINLAMLVKLAKSVRMARAWVYGEMLALWVCLAAKNNLQLSLISSCVSPSPFVLMVPLVLMAPLIL
jgi:hypothetical protein